MELILLQRKLRGPPMLKITVHSDTGVTKLVLEGRVTGPWAEELDRCWSEMAGRQHRQLVVDLTGVTFIDAKGKGVLSRMWEHGATFQAVGCLTRSIVDEISKAGCPGSSHSSPKDKRKGS